MGQLGNQEELFLPETVCSRKEQVVAMKSRMTRERHVRICESLGVKFPGATRPSGSSHYVHRRYMFGGEMADTRANEKRSLALGSREKAKKVVLNQAAWFKD